VSLFHVHDWRVVGRDHVPRAGNFKFGGGAWSEPAADALYGYTTLSLRCEVCGDVRTRKVAGRWERNGQR
jgi:hypothetical protein